MKLTIGEGAAVQPSSYYDTLAKRFFEDGRSLDRIASFGTYTGSLIIEGFKDAQGFEDGFFIALADRFARRVQPPFDQDEHFAFSLAAVNILDISSKLEQIDQTPINQ